MMPQAYGIMSSAVSEDFQYDIIDGNIRITKYSGSEAIVVVPSIIDGTPVTSIGSFAFAYCYSLSSITIPNSIVSIGNNAFRDCSKLTSITIPDSVASIGDYTFSGCTSLASVTIPNTVMSIGQFAFSECSSLTSITIGSGVTSIGGTAFASCSSLTDIKVAEANSHYTSIDGVLYSKDRMTLITCPAGKMGAFTVPNSVKSIGDYAFGECSSLTKITIPDGVTSIGEGTFWGCFSLTSITIPDGVTSIGDYAFYYCSKLTSITVPDGVTSIGEHVFESCRSLTSISIGNGVTSIGSFAFVYCTSLSSITIPNSVTSISYGAFFYCSNLNIMQFNGNAPSRPYGWGEVEPSLKVYYIDGAEGFDSSSWGGIERIALSVPGAPTDLKAAAGVGEASLTWAPPSNLGELIFYEVWFGTSVDSSTWTLFNTMNVLTATVTGLEHNTKYHFGVKAVNIAGASEHSTTSVTTLTSPDAPYVTAAAVDGQVELTWDAPKDGGADIIEYIIYLDGKEIARITDATKTSFVVNDLDNGVEYVFQVAARNAVGIGDKSEVVSATPRTVPNAPSDVEATLSDDHSSVTLVWKAPDFNGGSEIIGYEVWFRRSGGSSWTVLTDVNALTVTIDGLEHSSTYIIGVKTVNIAGTSDLTTTSVTTLATPAAPSVTVVADDGQVELTWNVPYDGGSAIVEYIIYRDGAELVRTTKTTCLVTGLTNGVEHKFQVAARNVIGIGDRSEATSVIPLPDEVPMYGRVVDADGNVLSGVTVSLDSGASVTTSDDGSFSFMASQGAHTLTISGGHIMTTMSNVAVSGMEINVGAINVNYASSGVFGDLKYVTADGKIAITGYVGPGGNVIIPSTINTMSVTSISSWAFQRCPSLTSVTLSDSITSIGNYAFYQCSFLTSVHIGIGVNSIGDGAFYRCASLTSVIIPGSVTYIGDYVFSLCSSLTSIVIPGSVTDIGDFTFSECASLISIEVAVDNANYAGFDGVLYNKDMTALIACPAGKAGAFVIPNGVASIEDQAFRDCSKLTSITIPDSVISIGWNVFYGCSSLTSMIIPGSVESLGDYAFSLCSSLASVTIENGVITIGDEAFSLCTNLTSIVIPNSVTSIGRSAFAGCSSLINVCIGNGVTSIDDAAFSGCYNLTRITIPSSVTSIGYHAFNACKNLTSMYFKGDAPGLPARWGVLKPGLKVYYIDGATGFDQSRWGEAELIALTTSSAPTDLEAIAGVGEVHLTWTAPTNDGGSQITIYEIWYGTSADSNTWTLFTTVNALTATVTGLEHGTTYYFGVKAVNFAGTSEFLTAFIMTPNTITFGANGGQGTVPGTIVADHDSIVDLPDAGDLVRTGYTFVGWSLTPSGEALGDSLMLTSDVTLYAVWKINMAIPSTVSGLVYNGSAQTGVIEGAGYTLSGHKAINAGEYTAMATLVDGYIWDDGTSEVKEITWSISPKEIIVTPDGQSKVFGDEDPILTYELSETVDVEGVLSRTAGEDVGTYDVAIGTLFAKSGNYILKMIDAGQFEITAAYPGAPNITNVEPDNGQVMLSWDVPYDGGADIGIYIVYRDGDEIVRTTGTSFVVAGLINGRAYTFQVAAKNAAGIGDKSETVSATPLPTMVPIRGKIVDADGNGLKDVKVSLKYGMSAMTNENGSFSFMAPQGVHVLTISGNGIETTTKNIAVNGMELDLRSISVTLLKDGDGDSTLLLAVVGAIVAAIVVIMVVLRQKK